MLSPKEKRHATIRRVPCHIKKASHQHIKGSVRDIGFFFNTLAKSAKVMRGSGYQVAFEWRHTTLGADIAIRITKNPHTR